MMTDSEKLAELRTYLQYEARVTAYPMQKKEYLQQLANLNAIIKRIEELERKGEW